MRGISKKFKFVPRALESFFNFAWFIANAAVCLAFSAELRENLSRLGANLKQSLIESARKTWESINEFARAHSTQGPDEQDAAVEEATEAKGNDGD